MGPSNILVSIAVTEGRRPFEKPGHRWEDITSNLTDMWHGVDLAG
jgi:hypothetical protein